MLTDIFIENYTIIESLALTFGNGMTVLTGETGAGKSIIIDALALLLGDKADIKAIRAGTERCEITASFDISANKAIAQWLLDNEFESIKECIIRRIITLDGRSKAWLNGRPIALHSLRDLGELLINIHGQHEHQTLLKRDEQLRLLDTYAGIENIVEETTQLFMRWKKLTQQLNILQNSQQEQTAKLDLLHYQIQELDELDLKENEFNELEIEYKQLVNAESLIHRYQELIDLLEDNNQVNVVAQLQKAIHISQLLQTMDATSTTQTELIENAIIHIREAAIQAQHCLQKIEIDPQRLLEVEQRLQLIHHLARKHHTKPEFLFERYQLLQQEKETMLINEQQSAELASQIESTYQAYSQQAAVLTQKRREAAHQFSDEISASMQQLAMIGGEFFVSLEPYKAEEPRPKGLEYIEFMVSTNPGQPLQPLSKIVSGGELSRISLAIQVITATRDASSTLIFDEVDVGIGGSTAAIVGKLLHQLGQTNQVFCITHLAQVAAYGDYHYKVTKTTDEITTYTQITCLKPEQRIEEIARMLGGLTITEQTIAHAKEMLNTG